MWTWTHALWRPMGFLSLVMLAGVWMGSRCGGAEAVSAEELRRDVAPAFDYGLYSDERGRLVGESSGVWLVHRGEHLEKVYADAQAGQGRARTLFGQLETATEAAGESLADRALGMGCSALPTCTVRWAELGELIPSPGPGGVRLREALARGFERQARHEHLENAVTTAVLDALMVGGVAMAVEGRAAGAEVKAAVAEGEKLAPEGLAARRALGEVAGAVEREEAAALEARLEEAEFVTEGARQSGDLKILQHRRPSLQAPPPGVDVSSPGWADYVSYWARRYEELAGSRPRSRSLPEAKPPLEWPDYAAFRSQVKPGVEFQHRVTRALQRELALPQAERVYSKGMTRPRVDGNLGLAREPGPVLAYVDQFVVDEASLVSGAEPSVHCFSNKQRNFMRMSEAEVRHWVTADIREALMKYGGRVEVRRPDHPLFGREVRVTRVHLVYDEQFVSESTVKILRFEARSRGVDLHLHGQ